MRGLLLLTVLLVSPGTAAGAPVDQGDLQRASAAYAEARERLKAGDPDAAIMSLTAGLESIPDDPGYGPTRAGILLLIVDAHDAGFMRDGDLERLRTAQRLLVRFLGPLDLLDEQGRAAAEDRRARLVERIAGIEADRRRVADERRAAERHERAILARRQARSRTIAAAVTMTLGGASLAVMAVGASVGRAADARINELAAADPVPNLDERLQAQLRRGSGGNSLFIVGATLGGALLSTGAVLLLVARRKHREARVLSVQPAPAISKDSFGLALVGRF